MVVCLPRFECRRCRVAAAEEANPRVTSSAVTNQRPGPGRPGPGPGRPGPPGPGRPGPPGPGPGPPGPTGPGPPGPTGPGLGRASLTMRAPPWCRLRARPAYRDGRPVR